MDLEAAGGFRDATQGSGRVEGRRVVVGVAGCGSAVGFTEPCAPHRLSVNVY